MLNNEEFVSANEIALSFASVFRKLFCLKTQKTPEHWWFAGAPINVWMYRILS